jgi:signal transduction histidine kinase
VTFGIIQEHAGTIEALSREGEGTTFRMTFPTAQKRSRTLAVS